MSDERKRIIEQTASTEIFDDDWFIKDSALHNTTKISQTVLKQEILKDVKGVVELTQAEYDALPSSKLTDGILYAIKDSEDIIGNIENAIDTLSGDIDDLEELVSTEMYNTAPMWSGSSYTFDDLVVYGIDGRLYRCIVRNSTANQFVSSEWQATDIKTELYLLLQQIAPQFIASSQSYTQVYYKGNLVLHTNDYGVNTFFVCKQDLPQGDTEWVANHWEEVNTVSGLSKYLMDKIAEAGQIDDVQVKTTGDYESVVDNKVAKIDLSNMLIEKSVPNLPQSIATFNDGSDLPLKSLTASIVPVQSGSGDPSPTNVRPISGWTEEVVSVRGVNQWDEEWEHKKGYSSGSMLSSDTNIASKNYISCKPTTAYYFKIPSTLQIYVYQYDSNKDFIKANAINSSESLTTESNTAFLKFASKNDKYSGDYNHDISINYPSTDTEYHEYSGTTTTIPFTDSQGQSVEVFGGSVDVVNGGEQPNPLKKVVFDGSNDEDWRHYGGNRVTVAVDDFTSPASGVTANIMCDKLKTITKSQQGSAEYVISGSDEGYHQFMVNVGISDITELRTWLSNNPITVAYELATPTTFYTQPTSIKSLDGDNNVFASTGDVTKLEFIANATDVIANLEARVTALES